MWGVWVNLINKINEQIEFKHEISIKCKKIVQETFIDIWLWKNGK